MLRGGGCGGGVVLCSSPQKKGEKVNFSQNESGVTRGETEVLVENPNYHFVFYAQAAEATEHNAAQVCPKREEISEYKL